MVKPAQRSESPPKGQRQPKPQGGAGGSGPSGADAGGSSLGKLCHFFLKNKCNRGDDCQFSHLPKEEMERQARAQAKAKAKAQPKAEPKAKAQPKARGKATNLVPSPCLVGPRLVNAFADLAVDDEE